MPIEIAGLVIHTDAVDHPLLGEAHIIEHAGEPITALTAIDWDRPTQIPAIAEPRVLPPGTGTLLMNELARRAVAAGVQTLRYAGPYPTNALFQSLLRSFRTDGTEEEFTRDALDRAIRRTRTEIEIDFHPAPFVRRDTAYGFVDLRDGRIDRARIDGILYEPTGDSLARLLASASNGSTTRYQAVLAVADDLVVARIAALDAHGVLLEGPHPVPSFAAPAVGSIFPPDLAAQLAELATMHVPAPLAVDVQRVIAERPIRWADLGATAARRTPDGFALHVAFLAVAKVSMRRFAELLSYHLARVAQASILEEVLASRP